LAQTAASPTTAKKRQQSVVFKAVVQWINKYTSKPSGLRQAQTGRRYEKNCFDKAFALTCRRANVIFGRSLKNYFKSSVSAWE
jgi:hypothetical protein